MVENGRRRRRILKSLLAIWLKMPAAGEKLENVFSEVVKIARRRRNFFKPPPPPLKKPPPPFFGRFGRKGGGLIHQPPPFLGWFGRKGSNMAQIFPAPPHPRPPADSWGEPNKSRIASINSRNRKLRIPSMNSRTWKLRTPSMNPCSRK